MNRWPEMPFCHRNVEMWLRYNPTDLLLRGYMILEPQVARAPWIVMPHSAIIREGRMIDITPRCYRTPHPFVVHDGTEAEWEMMKIAQLVEVPS
jgi:hypothetical protein